MMTVAASMENTFHQTANTYIHPGHMAASQYIRNVDVVKTKRVSERGRQEV